MRISHRRLENYANAFIAVLAFIIFIFWPDNAMLYKISTTIFVLVPLIPNRKSINRFFPQIAFSTRGIISISTILTCMLIASQLIYRKSIFLTLVLLIGVASAIVYLSYINKIIKHSSVMNIGAESENFSKAYYLVILLFLVTSKFYNNVVELIAGVLSLYIIENCWLYQLIVLSKQDYHNDKIYFPILPFLFLQLFITIHGIYTACYLSGGMSFVPVITCVAIGVAYLFVALSPKFNNCPQIKSIRGTVIGISILSFIGQLSYPTLFSVLTVFAVSPPSTTQPSIIQIFANISFVGLCIISLFLLLQYRKVISITPKEDDSQ